MSRSMAILTVVCATLAMCAIVGAPPTTHVERAPAPTASDAAAPAQSAKNPEPPSKVQPPPAAFAKPKRGDPVELVLISERDPWLLAEAAPLAARLQKDCPDVQLLVISSPPDEEAVTLLQRLKPRRSLVLTSQEDPDLARGIEKFRAEVVVTGTDPAKAAGLLARRFWGTSEELVAASAKDLRSVLTGAALASHFGLPFVPVGVGDDRAGLGAIADTVRAKRILVIADSGGKEPPWVPFLKHAVQVLDAPGVNARLVRRLGSDRVRNLILTRLPDPNGQWGLSAWMAPYLSVARGAPVVWCDESDGLKAEAAAKTFIEAHKLKPRSVTILADHVSISTIAMKGPAILGEYELEVEPCSMPGKGGASAYGVGRIPAGTPGEASALIARILTRDRLLARQRFRMLMIANPATQFGPLPLCETVSRISAEEFKNCRVAADEFYGKPSSDPKVMEAAGKAHLIIFEGHITDQLLFTDPVIIPEEEPRPEPEPGPGIFIGAVAAREPAPADLATDEREPPQAVDPPGGEAPQPEEERLADPEAPKPNDGKGNPNDAPLPVPANVARELVRAKPAPPLHGLPLVILQSCHSLEEQTARVVFRRGGSALIGSVTNIHSASGSSFVKAFCDGVLYRGDTAGEALRDARNYFLCLAALKAQRGHKQQAKVVRVALSFRLWGDPEMRVVHRELRTPKLRPVSVTFEAPDTLTVAVPTRRLPNVKTEKYEARMFPGSQAAGIVKRLKNQPQRRLMPIYFTRMDLPDAVATHGFTQLRREEDKDVRSVFMVDDHRRHLYVLHLPGKEQSRARFTLRFAK